MHSSGQKLLGGCGMLLWQVGEVGEKSSLLIWTLLLRDRLLKVVNVGFT